VADLKFLQDYVGEVFGGELNHRDFDTLGSWSGYKTGGILKPSIQENQDNQKTSIIILDADQDFQQRREEVLHDFDKFGVPIELFLFPNNQAPGSLEDILSAIGVDQAVFNCFYAYEGCIAGRHLPVKKSRIFAYLDAMLPPGQKRDDKNDQIQEKNRNYRRADIWDLHHPYLSPLRDFFSQMSFN
jgi:hypothetical protein